MKTILTRIIKKVSLTFLTSIFIFNSTAQAEIPDVPNKIANVQTLMESMHKQVDLYQLNVGVLNNNELLFSPKKKNGKETREGKIAQNSLTNFLKNCPDGEDYIIGQIRKHEDVAAIGYITIDLLQDSSGQLVPDFSKYYCSNLNNQNGIEANALYTKRGSSSNRGTCTLYTTVYKGAYNSSLKKYNFSTHTRVSWSEPKWLGGENYHGEGWDYVLQALPNSFIITSDSIDTNWWHTDGSTDRWWHTPDVDNENKYVSRNDGGNNYIRWAVKDEAEWGILGNLTAVADIDLIVTSKGPGSTEIRKINSWYVHTWDSISLTVSVSATNKKETSLTITPSTESHSWKIYSYVNFTDSTFE